MSGIVLTFPILADKVETWRRFCQELSGSRRKPYEASRQRLGITREQLALVENTYGAMAVTTLEAPNVAQALGQIIASHLPFDVWYRKRLRELHGVNLSGYEKFIQPIPISPNQELHFEWKLKPNGGEYPRDDNHLNASALRCPARWRKQTGQLTQRIWRIT
jgi:hypothetical protein